MCNNKFSCCLLLLIISFLMNGRVNGQQVSFIHLQTENNQSFQVSWNGNNFSSSSSGYLVIPQVTAGTHQLLLTFPADLTTEIAFSIVSVDKPRGFSLRQGIDNSWTMFDMIDFSIVKGTAASKLVQPETVSKILDSNPPGMSEKKTVEMITPAVVEVPVIKTTRSLPGKPMVGNKREVQKIFDKTGSAGIDQVYIINVGGKVDTVALFIPNMKIETPKVVEQNKISFKNIELSFPSIKPDHLLPYFVADVSRFQKMAITK